MTARPDAMPELALGTPPRVDAAALLVCLYLALVAGMVVVYQFPPLLDYANHYARLWLISGGIETQPFSDIYMLEWDHTATNLGIDLLTGLLGRVVGVDVLARIFLFLAITLPPLGAILLHRRLFGPGHLWPVAILFCSWCSTMIGGFINFQIGLGLALVFATIDLSLRSRGGAAVFVWRMAAGLMLTLMHIFSVGFFLVLIAALTLPADLRSIRSGAAVGTLAGRIALAAAATLAAPGYIFLTTDNPPADYQGSFPPVWFHSFGLFVRNLLSGIASYDTAVDLLFLAPIAGVIAWAAATGRILVHGGLLLGAAGLFLVSCLSPTHILGTGWISWRFPIMTGLAFLAAIRPLPFANARQVAVLAAALVFAVFGRTAWIAYNWAESERDLADVREALAHVPPGAALLPLVNEHDRNVAGLPYHRVFAGGHPTIWHYPSLGVPYARAFVPNLFAARGKQPLVVRGPWREIAVQDGLPTPVSALACPQLFAEVVKVTPYVKQWRERFDYAIVIGADMPDKVTGFDPPPATQRIHDGRFADLYRIEHGLAYDPVTPYSQNCPG